MEFLKFASDRFSVRKFSDEIVSDEAINKILEAGNVAPTAHNNQPQKIFVIKSNEGIKKLRKCTECHYNTKLAFLICYDKNISWKREYDGKDSGDIDASIVTTHMMLEAKDLGIGSTWVMYFIPEAVKVEFALPDNIEPCAILVMGYPDPSAKPAFGHKSKKSISDIVTYL